MPRLLRALTSVQTIVLLVFLFVALSLQIGTVSAADLGNECEIQGQFVSGGDKVTITGTEFTFQGDNLVVPGFFNISTAAGTPSKTLDTYTKFVSNGKYIVISEEMCISIALIEYEELKVYKPTKNDGDACEYITDKDAALKDNIVFDGTLVEGTSTFCSYFILGATVACIGSFCATLGMNLQKMTHDKLEKKGDRTTKYYTQPIWVIGMALIVLDGILDVATFGMAPAAMLAPLASLVLVHNVILAPCLLNEKVDKKGLIATFIIIAGSLVATLSAVRDFDVFISSYKYFPLTNTFFP